MNFAIFLVLTSGFFHALWNVCTKKSLNKQAFLFGVQTLSFVVFAPICIPKLFHGNFSSQEYLLFAASMITHGLYFILLAKLYTASDLSQSYPIIRGSSLMIVPLFGVTILGEQLSILGWIGIVLIISGIFFISEIRLSRLNLKTLQLSLLVGLSIALYIIIDRLALYHTDPITLNQIGTLGNILALTPFVAKNNFKNLRHEFSGNYKGIIIGAILAPCSYMLFLYAANMAPISTLTPIREFGTVFGALIGVVFLKEPNGKNRIAASLIITCGMILLATSH